MKIKLFVADIDGCLSMPYTPFRMDKLAELASWAKNASVPGTHPERCAISLCSGRSFSYVEAMAQLLALETPVLFESGAGMFDLRTGRSRWHPAYTADIAREVDKIRRVIADMVADWPGLSIDHGKRAQAALVGSIEDGLSAALSKIAEYVRQNHRAFITFNTPVSIDVVPECLTKRDGIKWLADSCGILMSEIAFIGDTNGDVLAMEACGASFAPSNADAEAKSAADHVSSLPNVEAVIEAYRLVAGF